MPVASMAKHSDFSKMSMPTQDRTPPALLSKDVKDVLRAVNAVNDDSMAQATIKTTKFVTDYLRRILGSWHVYIYPISETREN